MSQRKLFFSSKLVDRSQILELGDRAKDTSNLYTTGTGPITLRRVLHSSDQLFNFVQVS